MAKKRFYQMERRMQCNHKLHKEYVHFMREYINLGHMKEDPTPGQVHQWEVFLPHHSVIKADSDTAKLRVVFSGSARGTKGLSLNKAQFFGPKDDDVKFPLSARAVSKDSYVDDVPTGADILTEALELRDELIKLCDGGKFKLRK
ncbi:hypothetical protein QTP88_012820 [Uroleucon formosanum]